jgi:hypothetical protein
MTQYRKHGRPGSAGVRGVHRVLFAPRSVESGVDAGCHRAREDYCVNFNDF